MIEFPASTETIQSEQAIEARLWKLASLVADLNDSGFGILLEEDMDTRDAFEELRVKEAALRWIVRVAKHSSGEVRKRLWSDIEEAVAGLEKTAGLLTHASFCGTHSGPAGRIYKGAVDGQAFSN